MTECPECGESTRQFLRGWEEGYTKYRCGHCRKPYKIDNEDVVLGSQLGFKVK